MKRILIAFGIVGMCAIPGFATEADFYIYFKLCKMTVGYLVLEEDSLKVIPGDATAMTCTRRGSDISCSFEFQEGAKGTRGTENYKVVLDSPPYLHFASENWAEFIAVDTSKHAAVLNCRVIDQQFSGAKICHGLYATSFEVKNLEK